MREKGHYFCSFTDMEYYRKHEFVPRTEQEFGGISKPNTVHVNHLYTVTFTEHYLCNSCTEFIST